MRLLIISYFYLLILASCSKSRHEYVKLICTENETDELITDFENRGYSLVENVDDIIHEMFFDYSFSVKLPERFEYCGYRPVYMCSIGEPDSFYAIDDSLREEIVIKIETNKYDQKNYGFYFPLIRDSIRETMTLSQIENSKYHGPYVMKFLGLTEYQELTPTICTISNFEFGGTGFNGFSKRGYKHSEYNIYGYKNGVLIGLFYRRMGIIDKEIISELYCIMNDLIIKTK